jgi:hypothetical protein
MTPDNANQASSPENVVTSERVRPIEHRTDDAATVSDVESDAPMPKSVSEALAAVTPAKAPDGSSMDSQAEDEAAVTDTDAVEDVLPDPKAPVEPGKA